jgi:hypothetical protein
MQEVMMDRTDKPKCIIFMMMIGLTGISTVYSQTLTPYPGSLTIEGQIFTSGIHWYAHPGTIISPGSSSAPVDYSVTANVKYQSATGIVLQEGFHAHDFQNNGQFLAKINPGLDMVLLSPDPATSIINGVVHVPKWEKLEIAMKLPDEYMEAIDRFFFKCYNQTVDPLTDLNPYAFDSLEVRFDLVSPSNISHTRYAFFMREASWDGTLDESRLTAADPNSPLNNYKFRFRFSPDEISGNQPWSFQVTIRNPQGIPGFPTYIYSGLSFICDPNLSDNHGYLQVSPVNNRYLQFEDGTPFFAIGENIPDVSHGWADWNVFMWYRFYRRDFEQYLTAMDELASVGANYISTSFYVHTTALEYEHLGIYDSYGPTPDMCPDNSGYVYGEMGNRQYNAWVMDQIFNKAREKGIYIQLVVDPTAPSWAYQKYQWGGHTYMHNYVYNAPLLPPNNTIDTKRYFISEDPATNPNWANEGVLYYWKRRYQYIMSRWGYSTNIAMIQPFKEIDAILNYLDIDMTQNPSDFSSHICSAFIKHYVPDPALTTTIHNWHDVILPFVKTELGFDNHLFTVSYFDATKPLTYYDMFSRADIDVMDIHSYNDNMNMNASRFYALNSLFNNYNKPIHFGECSSFQRSEEFIDVVNASYTGGSLDEAITKIYDNYDASFHNMIWASSMMGSCTSGLTWQREMVHWWKDAMPAPEQTDPVYPTSNEHLFPNQIFPVGAPFGGLTVINNKYYYDFEKLSDFTQELIDLSLLHSPNLIPKIIYSQPLLPGFECYYQVKLDPGYNFGDYAFGWIHNENRFWENTYYIKDIANYENYLYCANNTLLPSGIVSLIGFKANHEYDIYFYPSRDNQNLPIAQTLLQAYPCLDEYGQITGCIDFNLTLGCNKENGDYAFIVFPHFSSQRQLDKKNHIIADKIYSGFVVFPNPCSGVFSIIKSEDLKYQQLKVYNAFGELVLKQDPTVNDVYDFAGLITPGIYIIQIKDHFRKIVIL